MTESDFQALISEANRGGLLGGALRGGDSARPDLLSASVLNRVATWGKARPFLTMRKHRKTINLSGPITKNLAKRGDFDDNMVGVVQKCAKT